MTNEIKTWQERMFAEYGHDARNWKPDEYMIAEIAELRAKVESLAADAERVEKLLEFCTEAKTSFGPRGEIRAITMKFKNSVETSIGYRNELRKLIDEMKPAGNTKKEKA